MEKMNIVWKPIRKRLCVITTIISSLAAGFSGKLGMPDYSSKS